MQIHYYLIKKNLQKEKIICFKNKLIAVHLKVYNCSQF
jgi:hypothetical protein